MLSALRMSKKTIEVERIAGVFRWIFHKN
jgi:hypothetical protein